MNPVLVPPALHSVTLPVAKLNPRLRLDLDWPLWMLTRLGILLLWTLRPRLRRRLVRFQAKYSDKPSFIPCSL